VTQSSESFRSKAIQARLLAASAVNAQAREEYLRLAEKFETLALAEEDEAIGGPSYENGATGIFYGGRK
jgi:hypothetical protein